MTVIKSVSPHEAKRLIDDQRWSYLDVRSEPEYQAGHPAGAANIPVMHAGQGGMTPNPDFLAVVEAVYPKDTKLILGCKSGARSFRAGEILLKAGFTMIINHGPGFEGQRDAFGAMQEKGWGPAGLPVETETPGKSYAELKQKAGK